MFHGFFRKAALVVIGEDLAGDGGGSFDDEVADLVAEFDEDAVAVADGGLAGLGQDPVGGGAGLLRLALQEAVGRNAGLCDDLVRLDAGLAEDLVALFLGVGKFSLHFLGVGEAFGDLLAALVEHRENRPIGESVEEEADDAEADELRAKVNPVDAEGAGDFRGPPGAAFFRE
jgi:hypothetical protein